MDHHYAWRVTAPGRVALGSHREPPGRQPRIRRDAQPASPRAHARIARPHHRALPVRDAARARADLCARSAAEAQGRSGPPASAGGRGVTPGRVPRDGLGGARPDPGGQPDRRRGGPAPRLRHGRARGDRSRALSARTWPMLLRGQPRTGRVLRPGAVGFPGSGRADPASPPATSSRSTACAPRLTPVRAPLQQARALAARNTRKRSRKDIAAHYDLGNELFSRMLDPTMSLLVRGVRASGDDASSRRRSRSSSGSARSSSSVPATGSSRSGPVGARSPFTPRQPVAAT